MSWISPGGFPVVSPDEVFRFSCGNLERENEENRPDEDELHQRLTVIVRRDDPVNRSGDVEHQQPEQAPLDKKTPCIACLGCIPCILHCAPPFSVSAQVRQATLPLGVAGRSSARATPDLLVSVNRPRPRSTPPDGARAALSGVETGLQAKSKLGRVPGGRGETLTRNNCSNINSCESSSTKQSARRRSRPEGWTWPGRRTCSPARR